MSAGTGVISRLLKPKLPPTRRRRVRYLFPTGNLILSASGGKVAAKSPSVPSMGSREGHRSRGGVAGAIVVDAKAARNDVAQLNQARGVTCDRAKNTTKNTTRPEPGLGAPRAQRFRYAQSCRQTLGPAELRRNRAATVASRSLRPDLCARKAQSKSIKGVGDRQFDRAV
jgi:hypothetical protein